eukprot:PhM_4_TR8327/c0_g1_i1/m.21749
MSTSVPSSPNSPLSHPVLTPKDSHGHLSRSHSHSHHHGHGHGHHRHSEKPVSPRRRWRRCIRAVVFALRLRAAVRRADLTPDEMRTAKTTYERGGAMLTQEKVLEVLQSIGLYSDNLGEALRWVRFSEGAQLTFVAWISLLEILKREHRRSQRATDTEDVYMALGGSVDRTGVVSTETLRSVVRTFNLTIDIDRLIHDVDSDDSGQLDFTEFSAMFAQDSKGANNNKVMVGENSMSCVTIQDLVPSPRGSPMHAPTGQQPLVSFGGVHHKKGEADKFASIVGVINVGNSLHAHLRSHNDSPSSTVAHPPPRVASLCSFVRKHNMMKNMGGDPGDIAADSTYGDGNGINNTTTMSRTNSTRMPRRPSPSAKEIEARNRPNQRLYASPTKAAEHVANPKQSFAVFNSSSPRLAGDITRLPDAVSAKALTSRRHERDADAIAHARSQRARGVWTRDVPLPLPMTSSCPSSACRSDSPVEDWETFNPFSTVPSTLVVSVSNTTSGNSLDPQQQQLRQSSVSSSNNNNNNNNGGNDGSAVPRLSSLLHTPGSSRTVLPQLQSPLVPISQTNTKRSKKVVQPIVSPTENEV